MHPLPDFCCKRILILGCGNVLLGDDGFGPHVVEYLMQHYDVPDDVCVMDAGTGVRKILFALALSDVHPEEIVIVDAVDRGGERGQIVELPITDIPYQKVDDFSLHQAPTSNLLRELQDQRGIRVTVLVCDVGPVEPIVHSGLSDAVERAVPVICKKIAGKFKVPKVQS
jgi:coenzyme F420 hydrogenase subunit delta